MQSKESLKTVSLGTSKINYLDPRITVAWCKKHEVPIEKIYTKVLLDKFNVRAGMCLSHLQFPSVLSHRLRSCSGPWKRTTHTTSRRCPWRRRTGACAWSTATCCTASGVQCLAKVTHKSTPAYSVLALAQRVKSRLKVPIKAVTSKRWFCDAGSRCLHCRLFLRGIDQLRAERASDLI